MRYLRDSLSDQWSVGDRLPSEVELAEHLGVARGTVRSALKQLESEGLLAAARGAGRVVRAAPAPAAPDAAASPALAAAGALMRQSVVFARYPERPVANNAPAVERAILDAFAGRGNPLLAVDIARVGEADLDHLAAGRPLGVVAPHDAVDHDDTLAKLVRLADAGVHVVVQGDGPRLLRFDRVISDHAAGMALLVDHLRGRGCRRMVQVRSHVAGGPTAVGSGGRGPYATLAYWAATRYAEFDRLAVGPGGDGRTFTYDLSPFGHRHEADDAAEFERLSRVMAGVLVEHLAGPDRADALLFDTDFVCFYAAAAVRLFGLEPGRDVLIAGYDDYWSTSPLRRFESAVPDVTVDKDETAAGETLADLLLDAPPEPRDPAAPGRLRVRSPSLHVTARGEPPPVARDARARPLVPR